MDKLKDQLMSAINDGHIVTFHPTKIKGEMNVCVRHRDHTKKFENYVVDILNLDISHIVLRKLCR